MFIQNDKYRSSTHMEKIVNSGFKIDLHIHSYCSKGKDQGRVSFNTLEHIPTLVERLTENEVKICAITDHDFFEYPLYRKLKDFETDNASSIIFHLNHLLSNYNSMDH